MKVSKTDLVKALIDAGQRESALLLKNWDGMDDVAKSMCKKLEKQMIPPSTQAEPPADPATAGVNVAKGDGTLVDKPEAGHKNIAKDVKSMAKDDAPHKPGSPEDSAHDVVEENSSLYKEIIALSPEDRDNMLSHLRSLKDKKKLRSPDNKKKGRD